ncbi:VOC family protein [Phaeobacter gallaeciensis]|uniref:VOC family protein n=2 Tax=Roseobacteraceae TaxID=2854170 RepID=A0A366X191_9RHOB|nr:MULTISPECIES: VOC family protein [Roseobacteraceae]MBT3143608.1 VOC family protein [Falsiruegeria litorea]MBT8167878.1 VOC family protein [Falsiruegeria litorea]RBW55457.1 VOC family protein [Phaeobacter gallaeciensis]
MDQRVSLITLGVPDMAHAATFYEALGWRRVETPDGVIAFDLIGQVLGLYPLEKLAEDMGLPLADLGQGAMTLSYNCRTKDDVGDVLKRAAQAGAEIIKPAVDVFWGGYHGYFRAPDGTIWEIAHNPFSALGPNGEFCWNGYS